MNNRNICYGHRGLTVLIALFCLLSMVQAQVPQWRLHPKYNSIELLGNGYYVVSNNGKYGIMNSQEKEIVPMIYDKLASFHSHMALLYKNQRYVGFVSDQGKVSLFDLDSPSEQYEIVGEPRFYEGYLLVKNRIGYYYLRASDGKAIGPFTDGRPFCGGYAIVKYPDSPKKVFNGDYTIQILSGKTGDLLPLNLGEYNVYDIDFISTVCNDKCIIVLKKRFHEYDLNTGMLTPIHTDGDITNKKSRVTANERPLQVQKSGDGYVASFKMGQMTFDSMMRLASIGYTGQDTKQIYIPEEQKEEHTSQLKSRAADGTSLLGLSYNGREILIPQFDKVADLWNDEALVLVDGKYGVVGIDPSRHCRFALNDNMAVGFEHKTANTSVKVVCPAYMKPALMKITSEDENCHISSDTRKESTNVESAVLSYQCTLDIPDEIGLDKTSTNTKLSLIYDGLKMTPLEIPYDTWYINNYNVEVKHAVESDGLKLNVFVRNRLQNSNYFRTVTLERADSIEAPSLTKINEEEYTATIDGWKDGTLRFSVDITEDGCPTISYAQRISVGAAKKVEKADIEPVVTVPTLKKRKTVIKTEKKEERKPPVKFY